MFMISTGDVSETPGSFKLQLGHILSRQERNESRNEVGIDDALDGRRVFER